MTSLPIYYGLRTDTAERPKKDAIKSFSVLKDLPWEIGYGAVICISEFPYGLADNVIAHSVWEI